MKSYTLLYFIVVLLFVTSCEFNDFVPEEWAITPELELSESGIVASSIAEKHLVKIKTNYLNFTASSNEKWCEVEIDKSDSCVHISVDSNEGTEQRTAIVTITVSRGNKSLSKDVAIFQVGGKWDIVEGTDIKLRWTYDITDSQKEVIKNQLRQLVYVEGGTFLMGAQNEDKNASNYYLSANEYNWVRQVTLSDYYIGAFEVTQEQWASIMGTTPSKYVGGNKPVENISWEDAQNYVTRLSNLTGLSISLPTSAQWEYAARGGKYSMGFKYSGSDDLSTIANFAGSLTPESSPYYTTIDVGQKSPNELGIYDMTGNVSELCSDYYGIVSTENQTDPIGPNSGNYHVERGGDFTSLLTVTGLVWSVSRFILSSTDKQNKTSYCGLRIVCKR